MYRLSTLGIVLFMLLSNPIASAQQDQAKPVKNTTQAAEQARRHVDGRVLKVDKTKSAYRVKMLKKSGRVVTLDVDKRSGEVKPSKRSKDGQ